MRPRIELQGERLFKIRIIVPSWTSDHEDCWVACGGVGGPCVSDSCVGYCCSASQDDLNAGCSQEMIDFLVENAENDYMHQCVYDENETMVPTTTVQGSEKVRYYRTAYRKPRLRYYRTEYRMQNRYRKNTAGFQYRRFSLRYYRNTAFLEK